MIYKKRIGRTYPLTRLLNFDVVLTQFLKIELSYQRKCAKARLASAIL